MAVLTIEIAERIFIMKTKKVFKRFIAFMLSTLCLFINCGIGLSISSMELTDEFSSDVAPEGYIPVESFDEVAMFALERESSITKKVLLVEDTLPWNSNANSAVLSSLGVSYDKVRTADFLTKNLGNYSVLIFANDQQFSTYANYSNFMTQVENFAALGGVVIFGACDAGWANGTMTTSLPGGISKIHQYANYNYIVDYTHPIVTGELIDNVALVDADLYSNYCSHTSFDEASLPNGGRIILRDKIQNAPTLVEYKLGNGTVIASGLTWEYAYTRSNYSKKAMADLFMYAIKISNANVDMAPPLAVSVTSPSKLKVVENELGNEEYSPNPFTITANIQNIGNGVAYNVNAELVLPDGMKIVSGVPKVSLGDIDVGANYAQVTWSVEVEPSDIDKIENYSIIITADNADTKTVEKQIEIPALLSSEVELYLKRGAIVDGETLRLNFKIKNVGSSKLDLSKIKTRYYYFDEISTKGKIFECDAVSFSPYSNLQNPQITMTDKKLETLHDKSTSYLEFNFNVSEELNPNQEIEVSTRIHTSDWSKLLLSNDYSAVGDDSLPSNDYVLWQYMPVYKIGDDEEIIWGSEPEIDTNGIEPDLLVEFASLSSNGSNNMDLNIKITNIGVLPIDLGQTEIKYYYTNDKKIAQTINCDNVAIQSSTSYIDVGSKVISEIVKMPIRKKNADTYVSMRFSENTGILNFEDYIILKLRIENENGKYGNIIDNDYSNLQSIQKQDLQTFSDVARAALFTPNMDVNENIVIDSAYCNIFNNSFVDCHFGIEPNEPYEPTFSAFKVGWGSEEKYTNGDYQSFIDGMTQYFNGIPYSDYSTGSNLDSELFFSQSNMNAILESDIAYISGHGYFGGVIPISENRTGSKIPKIFIANNGVGNNQFTDYYTDFNMNGNTFSFRVSDNNTEINDNLQWLIFGACSQLNDGKYKDHPDDVVKYDGKYSYQLWLNTLVNNSNMKGILGYWADAPTANFKRSDEDVMNDFMRYSNEGLTVYESWIKANEFKSTAVGDFSINDSLRCALLVKDDYANKNLAESLADNSNVSCNYVYLYKSKLILSSILIHEKDTVYDSLIYDENVDATTILNGVNTFIEQYDINIDNNAPVISEISKTIFDENGGYIRNEIIEYTVTFMETERNVATYSLNNNVDNDYIFRYNPYTNEVHIF